MSTIACKRILAVTLWAIIIAIASPVSAGEIVWKAQIWGPQRFSTQPFEWMAKELTAKTNGQIKIEFTYNQTKPQDSIDILKSNSADLAYFCTAYQADKMPLTTVLELPMFPPDNIPALAKVELALADHPAIVAELRKWNAKMLIPVPLSQYQIMSTRKIAKVDDFQGSKVRIAAETGKLLEEYGASTVVLSGPDSLAALKNGTLDVVALPYPSGFATFNVWEGAKYVTDKISLGTQLCYLAANQKSWEALPAKVQEAMLALRVDVVNQYEGIYARDDAKNIALFKEKGLEFVSFSPADRARLVAKAIKHWHAWVEAREAQGLKGKEVFEFTQAKIREFTRK